MKKSTYRLPAQCPTYRPAEKCHCLSESNAMMAAGKAARVREQCNKPLTCTYRAG